MGVFEEFRMDDSPSQCAKDTLKIKGGQIKGWITVHKFIDGDTNQHIFFCPSLDITSYGATEKKALEMFKSSVDQLFDHLTAVSLREAKDEFQNLGWEQNKMWNKQYSRILVDVKGELKNFNAIENTIETIQLVA